MRKSGFDIHSISTVGEKFAFALRLLAGIVSHYMYFVPLDVEGLIPDLERLDNHNRSMPLADAEMASHLDYHYRMYREDREHDFAAICDEYFDGEHNLFAKVDTECFRLVEDGKIKDAVRTIEILVRCYRAGMINSMCAVAYYNQLVSSLNRQSCRKPRRVNNLLSETKRRKQSADRTRNRRIATTQMFNRFWASMNESVRSTCLRSSQACRYCCTLSWWQFEGDAYHEYWRRTVEEWVNEDAEQEMVDCPLCPGTHGVWDRCEEEVVVEEEIEVEKVRQWGPCDMPGCTYMDMCNDCNDLCHVAWENEQM